ncbi:hypothetical protein GUJ93_ZPchr0012g20076 [Zizania palustris]|uniref:Uncharacterized protein n=1 Tax=Zizania palustris TaxID=103762 RepID=A0A8J6BR21_ZIZPA|nr:hypothetical protein GUJ93_ZPchr0012g20076 [Zizania palustris]
MGQQALKKAPLNPSGPGALLGRDVWMTESSSEAEKSTPRESRPGTLGMRCARSKVMGGADEKPILERKKSRKTSTLSWTEVAQERMLDGRDCIPAPSDGGRRVKEFGVGIAKLGPTEGETLLPVFVAESQEEGKSSDAGDWS